MGEGKRVRKGGESWTVERHHLRLNCADIDPRKPGGSSPGATEKEEREEEEKNEDCSVLLLYRRPANEERVCV